MKNNYKETQGNYKLMENNEEETNHKEAPSFLVMPRGPFSHNTWMEGPYPQMTFWFVIAGKAKVKKFDEPKVPQLQFYFTDNVV